MKKFAFALLLLIAPSFVWAQATNEQADTETALKRQVATLANYGSLVFDWGLNFFQDVPKEMKLSTWSSRTLNGYFYYNIPIKDSYFMVSPGIGLGSADYKFQDQYTLARTPSSRRTMLKLAKDVIPGSPEITSSSLTVNYAELVAELRFNANRQEPQAGFLIAVGYRLGMRWGAATTIQYKEDNQKKTRTTVESFNLNRLRHGLIGRIGWGRFGIFYSHTFSDFFNEGQGPTKATMMPVSAGISINLL